MLPHGTAQLLGQRGEQPFEIIIDDRHGYDVATALRGIQNLLSHPVILVHTPVQRTS